MTASQGWTKLDNAAKIFPANTTLRDTKVFRFSCELMEDVNPDALEIALHTTVNEFPFYLSVLKRGMFWHYFEASRLAPSVVLDDLPPCSPLYDRVRRQLLFRVTYFENRINLEVHHALADGTGASRFLCALVGHYLEHTYPQLAGVAAPDYDASPSQKHEDSFQKNYEPKRRRDRGKQRAYKVRSPRLPEWRMRVFEGVMPVSAALARAKARGASLTAYMTAQLITAVGEEIPLRHRDRPVVITVPVNLRPFYQSQTARNFFATMEIGCDFREKLELDDVIRLVKEGFARELTPEKMAERMNHMISLETNIISRSAPLPIKDIVLRAAGNSAKKSLTGAMSNLGIMQMPPCMRPYIRRFSVICATDGLQVCLCTFQDTLTAGFTSAFVSTDIPRRFFRQLAKDGIPVGIADGLIGEASEA